MNFVMTKAAIVAELTKRLTEAKAYDAKVNATNKVKHQKDEEAALSAFRASLREALTWDYKVAKKRSVPSLRYISCPDLSEQSSRVERFLRNIRFETREKLSLHDGSDLVVAMNWKPPKEHKSTICD